jgi:hypothetical protein
MAGAKGRLRHFGGFGMHTYASCEAPGMGSSQRKTGITFGFLNVNPGAVGRSLWKWSAFEMRQGIPAEIATKNESKYNIYNMMK